MTIDIEKELAAMSEKLGVTVEKLTEELHKYEADLMIVFDDETERKQAAFKQLRGSYRAQMKSPAKWYEGFFFAMKPVKFENRFSYEEAMKKFTSLVKSMGEAKAKEQAIADKMMNAEGRFLYMEEDLTQNSMWKKGKVIDEKAKIRELYGFFKEDGTQNIHFGVLRVRHNPDKFSPKILKVYRFRANGKEDGNFLLLNSASSTALTETEVDIEYDMFYQLLNNQIGHARKTFDEVYDRDSMKPKLPERPVFYVTIASISRYNVTAKDGVNVDFADITDLVGDFDDPVSMVVDKGTELCENSVGIAVYFPTVKTNKENEQVFSGNLYGFVTKESEGRPKEVKEIEPGKKDWE